MSQRGQKYWDKGYSSAPACLFGYLLSLTIHIPIWNITGKILKDVYLVDGIMDKKFKSLLKIYIFIPICWKLSEDLKDNIIIIEYVLVINEKRNISLAVPGDSLTSGTRLPHVTLHQLQPITARKWLPGNLKLSTGSYTFVICVVGRGKRSKGPFLNKYFRLP